MEINEENINKVAEVLRSKDFEKALVKVQDYSRIAEQLIKENPDLTVDQIGELYEQQMENERNTQQPETKDTQDQEESRE